MKRWIISDKHIDHDKIKTYCQRPADCDIRIIDNTVAMVGKDDILYDLGDAHFGKADALGRFLQRIRGHKVLIKGNHDHYSDSKYLKLGYDMVCDSLGIRDVLLTHEPVFIGGSIYKYNVHGHLHNIPYDIHRTSFGGSYAMFNDGNHILYAPEIYNYRPIILEKLIAKRIKC